MKRWLIQNAQGNTCEIQRPHRVLGPFEGFFYEGDTLPEEVLWRKGEKRVKVTEVPREPQSSGQKPAQTLTKLKPKAPATEDPNA